jgi:Mg/Co/Ni transporter MgtE
VASARSLTLAFIDRRPAAAARALTAMEVEDAAAFLDDVPARYATSALAHMSAWAASAVVARMSVEHAAGALRGLNYQTAAAVLRLVAPGPRASLLAELPAAVRRDFGITLSFPLDTVGAHMTTAILTQRFDHNVADARDLVRRARNADDACVMVLDETHRLMGVVLPVALLRATGATPLTDIMDGDVAPLSARARVATIAGLAAWDRYASLPVVSRRKHVIGALNRTTLRQILTEVESTGAHAADGLPVALADSLVGTIAGLARLLAPGPSPARDQSDRGGRQ